MDCERCEHYRYIPATRYDPPEAICTLDCDAFDDEDIRCEHFEEEDEDDLIIHAGCSQEQMGYGK